LAIFEWDDSFLTGLEDIDKQHKKIFKYLNSIYDYNKINQGDREIIKKVHSFLEFIFNHFDYEEDLIKKYNLPQGDEHIREHIKFKEVVETIFEKYASSPYALAFEFCKFVKEFYSTHITFFDKVLVREFNKHLFK
jgi:hemerythrin-like metal-binding protein